MTEQNGERLSVGGWLITMVIASIPLVGIIMMLVWAFGDGPYPERKNWSRAALIWVLVIMVLYAIIAFVAIAAGAGAAALEAGQQ